MAKGRSRLGAWKEEAARSNLPFTIIDNFI